MSSWLRLSLRIIISGVFLLSAITKLHSTDLFEVYIYQFGLFSFDWSAWIARLIIGAELLISFSMLTLLYFKRIWLLTAVGLFVASAFLIFKILEGDSSNCFCFGELISMTPIESLVKNAVLIGLLIPLRKLHPTQTKYSRLIITVASATAFVTPIILSPPDNIIPNRISKAEMDAAALDLAFSKQLLPQELLQGKKVVCFYSTSCSFCKLASSRLSAAFQKHKIESEIYHPVFLSNSERAILDFIEHTEGIESAMTEMNSSDFLSITKGRMPMIVLMTDGRVETVWNYRQIDEAELLSFLNDTAN